MKYHMQHSAYNILYPFYSCSKVLCAQRIAPLRCKEHFLYKFNIILMLMRLIFWPRWPSETRNQISEIKRQITGKSVMANVLQ